MKPGNRRARGRVYGAKFRQSQFWKMRADLSLPNWGAFFDANCRTGK